ncbi:hypothetical protein ACFL0P_02315 [Candidatus Omnitrophota bacterium]
MGYNVEKFKNLCKDKGFLVALGKTMSYMTFLARRRNLEKTWSRACLRSGRLEVKGWNTGPRFFWNGKELTKSAGMNTAIFVNGRWHDSSKANWKLAHVESDSLVLRNAWNSLPIKETWIISKVGNDILRCEVKIEPSKEIEFIEQKFILMLSEKFNQWFDSANNPVKFLEFKEWSGIKQVKKDSDFIGVQSNVDKTLPKVTLRKIGPGQNLYAQIENSDVKTKAPLLSFVSSVRDRDLKYKKGSNPFFKVEIKVK